MVCRRRHSPCLGPSYRLLPVPIIRNCRTRVHLVHSREDRQHSQPATPYGRQATSSDSSKHPSRALRRGSCPVILSVRLCVEMAGYTGAATVLIMHCEVVSP
ncbi:hypothetical protein K466DRAFT_74989 [Polyporus arcularius HHB13444]|uniref:Uncharacterized protein n=1 Tax=Polyporus arcularius HHB13444 TaxID=1314778 RepID=A0A5C3NLC5_9APHY|nr:hypothetical protein K466DRAFT_74989 [Polyporus arcularius HHB13444]